MESAVHPDQVALLAGGLMFGPCFYEPEHHPHGFTLCWLGNGLPDPLPPVFEEGVPCLMVPGEYDPPADEWDTDAYDLALNEIYFPPTRHGHAVASRIARKLRQQKASGYVLVLESLAAGGLRITASQKVAP